MDLHSQVKQAILNAIPEAEIEIYSEGSHFDIAVISNRFEGKSLLEKQRMVYSAIAPFMEGPEAPIHAVDRLITKLP